MYLQKLPPYLSQEQKNKILLFVKIIQDWQKSINLLSKSQDEQHIWHRHILDCCRILPLIEVSDTKTIDIFDLGSGAGFPGIILAIAKQNANIHLIEHKNKKCLFLQHVISKLKIKNAIVHSNRIEKWSENNQKNIFPDIITARAVAPIEKIIDYIQLLKTNKPSTALLFCGSKTMDKQIQDARKKWHFDVQIFHEKTKTNIGPIIKINKIRSLDKPSLNNIKS